MVLVLDTKFCIIFEYSMPGQHGRYSDSLGAGRFGDRIPGWVIFFAPVQTGPEIYLPPMQWINCRSFPTVKRLGRGI